jgi:hypothetical protein
MYKEESYNNISKNCLNIIKNNSPEKSINIISKMKIHDNKIGNESALKIYKSFSSSVVDYDSKLYCNNVSKYKEKVRVKIDKATKAANQ